MSFTMPLQSQFAAITIDPLSIARDLPGSIDFGDGRYIIINPSFEIEEFWQRQLLNLPILTASESSSLCSAPSRSLLHIPRQHVARRRDLDHL